ncbi:uncharacterized protein SPSK_02698 [Sporothrix schenckii 1099-18]|nr:uncharacterized protein SPSK_02698 [Sporothrix schenckii 1099-18]KJR86289.1 hypothetical protein SPSK_02698 [Sporothrix schenckii 1099-18]
MAETKQTEIVGVRCPKGCETIMTGGTGAVYGFKDRPDVVVKLPYETDRHKARFDTEKAIFRRLGSHPHVVPCLGIEDNDRGGRIYMARAKHTAIRGYFREGGTASLAERVRWCRDLAAAVHYIHDKGVRWGDIGGRNILFTADRNIWICDFAGSGLDGVPPIVWGEDGFRHPDDESPETSTGTMPCEIHALGSAMYELITSRCPHWKEEAECRGRAAGLLRRGVYPDVSDVALGDVIQRCWKGEYTSAREVAEGIEEKMPQYENEDKPF